MRGRLGEDDRDLSFHTRLVHFEASPGDACNPTVTPIYQTATFEQESAVECGQYDYTRSGNPTRAVLEKQLAGLEHGTRAFCFTSGLAAITAVTRLLRPGDEIVACNDVYGGTYRLFSRILKPCGIGVRYVDARDLNALRSAITPKTKLIHLETPTNPLLRIIDIEGAAAIAHEAGALLSVDNSALSPYLQNPLDLGADIVVHSGTKYLCGHSDVVAGAVVVNDQELADRLYLIQNGEGAGLSPFDSFLLLRGLKTLALRLDRQQQNALTVARFLARHEAVRRVHYPGLEEHEGYTLHQRQARGPGALITFETGDCELSRLVAERARLFAISVSFGGVGSSISIPSNMSHASIPEDVRAMSPCGTDAVRLSIGIEDAKDLIADLDQALSAAARSVPGNPDSLAAAD